MILMETFISNQDITNDVSIQYCIWIDMEPFYSLVDKAVKVYNYNQKGDTQP